MGHACGGSEWVAPNKNTPVRYIPAREPTCIEDMCVDMEEHLWETSALNRLYLAYS